MKQPSRRKKEIKHVIGTGEGLDYCDECPFFDYKNGNPYCNINDIFLKVEDGKIPVPKRCGNNKNTDEKDL